MNRCHPYGTRLLWKNEFQPQRKTRHRPERRPYSNDCAIAQAVAAVVVVMVVVVVLVVVVVAVMMVVVLVVVVI